MDLRETHELATQAHWFIGSDSVNAINWPRRMHDYLIYVGMFSMKLRSFFYRRINREGNCVADSLAKQSLQRQTSFVACL